MLAIRLAVIAAILAAAFYVGSLPRPLAWGESVVVMLAIATMYEIGVHRLRKKIARWPDDVTNGEEIVNLLTIRDGLDEIRTIEFGSVSNELLDRLRMVMKPGLKAALFHDAALQQSYDYLREQLSRLLGTIRSEMFLSDTSQSVELPREWKALGNSQYARYRQAQKDLLVQSNKVIAGVDAFANCLKGASMRI